MKRRTQRVQSDECGYCGALVLTASWDDLNGQPANITVDAASLDEPTEVACIIANRKVYALEQTAAATFRLSWLNEDTRTRQRFGPDLHLPDHRCQTPFPGAVPLPADVWRVLTPDLYRQQTSEEVPF